ncbi:MAG: UDP-N-acetylmuramoyl-tripeptide--D-alanyl-D-alanine ligase [Clostridia bacterium]|nr:UDP-N-acetylmuramoyl-tripeptide--D-alanyl-D-alanine ligase [Clostridia bacterium]
MNIIYQTICLVLGLVGIFLLQVRQLQMLQQNSYFASRYTKWLVTSFTVLKTLPFVTLVALLIFGLKFGEATFVESIPFFSAVTLWLGVIAFKKNNGSIKKLVFTARIKRTLCFTCLLFAALGVLGLVFTGTLKCIFLGAFYFLAFVPPIVTLVSLFALKPVEKCVANYYINDAKKLLSSRKDLKVIGITGSFGKTGTKYILSRILREKYNVLMTPESFNTPMGVVRTIREKLRGDTEIFVCEMGAKNIGDIKEICDIVHPDSAIITSVGPQHLETFLNIENVLKTKFELRDAVAQKGGLVLANGDNEHIAQQNGVILYGTGKNCEYRAENITGGRNGVSFDLVFGDEKINVSSKLLGNHNVQNITGAAALAYKLGVPLKNIAFAISRLSPVEHRLEMKSSVNGSLLIDDAYNANPEGSLEAVNVLSSFEGMTKIIITPGLVELGEKEFEYNKGLGAAAAKVCDKIIFVGENRSKPLKEGALEQGFDEENLFVAKSFAEAMEIYTKFADSNTVVLLENDLPDNYLN